MEGKTHPLWFRQEVSGEVSRPVPDLELPGVILKLRGRTKISEITWLFSTGGNQPFFVYQSALIAVKFAHFSGRSSKAKIAVTGQTGTHAQSMHSTGLM
jgi:hypothetical protein